MVSDVYKKVRLVLWIILFANIGVAISKIIIGTMIKSVSITADGLHSMSDGSSNIVGLIGLQLASKPIDEDHPYGHRKFETLAGLFIAGMLFFVGGRIIVDAIGKMIHYDTPDVTPESLIILLATLCINIFISTYEYKKGKELRSQILLSDSMHTRSDIYVSIGVLVTLICIKIGFPPVIDSIASLLVAGFIIHAAYEIFKDNGNVLVDKVAVSTDKIRDITLGFEQVKDIRKIRSRGSEDDLHIDLHIRTEADMSVEESYQLIHRIEGKIREAFNENVQVMIQIEPFQEERKLDEGNLPIKGFEIGQ